MKMRVRFATIEFSVQVMVLVERFDAADYPAAA